MHELCITCSIVAIVANAARGRKVHRVTVEIGQLSGVMTDAIAFCFRKSRKGTAVEGANLDIREIDGACALRDLRHRIRHSIVADALPVRLASATEGFRVKN